MKKLLFGFLAVCLIISQLGTSPVFANNEEQISLSTQTPEDIAWYGDTKSVVISYEK